MTWNKPETKSAISNNKYFLAVFLGLGLFALFFYLQLQPARGASITCQGQEVCVREQGVPPYCDSQSYACDCPANYEPVCEPAGGGGSNCGSSQCSGYFEVCQCKAIPLCVPNKGAWCQSAPNSCGDIAGGEIKCDGSCSAPAVAPDRADEGATCYSAPNSCGDRNQGQIHCGLCYAWPTERPGYGQWCQSAPNSCGDIAGGSIQCDGSCSAPAVAPNRPSEGASCTSAPNDCGQTSTGSIHCDLCYAWPPPSPAGQWCQSAPNSCGDVVGGVTRCDGSCTAPGTAPQRPGYGDQCYLTSSPNQCGIQNTCFGTKDCDGNCSGSCAAPPNCESGQVCRNGGCCDPLPVCPPGKVEHILWTDNICGPTITCRCPDGTIDNGFGGCVSPACSSNADCNDGNSCTYPDTCVNPGQASAYCTSSNNPVNGGWSSWSGWSGWSACSGGSKSRSRTRSCDNPNPSCGGSACSGPSSETEVVPCVISCSSNSDCNDGSSCTTDSCSNPGTESSYCTNTNNPVNGGWSSWSSWSSCVNYQQSRTRACTNPAPACGGGGCSGPASETQSCGSGPTATISASPNPVVYNTASTVTWSSTNADSCSVSPTGWSGTSGSRSTGNLTSPATYTLTCTNPLGQGQNSVTVNVQAPGSFTLNAPSASCSGASSRVSLSWGASSGATNYKVYRNGSLYQDVGTATSFTDTSVIPGTAYSYFIRASNPIGTRDSNTQNTTAVFCQGDLYVTAKLNGQAWSGASNIKYRLLGPGSTITENNANMPMAHTDKDLGLWTMDYQSGSPSNSVFSNVTPAATQTLPSGQTVKPTLTYVLNFVSSIPTVDLKANNSDGPVSVAFGSAVTLSWTSTDASSCTASASPANSNWTGAKAVSGSQSSGNLNSEGAKVFTLTCAGTGGSGNDSVTVNVGEERPPDGGCANNCVAPVSLSHTPACEQVALTWTDNAPNETGFRIWRSPSFGGTTISYSGRTYSLLATRPAQAGTGSTGSYTDASLSPGTYYYVVTAFNTGGDSDISGQNSLGPVTVGACVANLVGSQKTLLQYRVSPTDSWQNYSPGVTVLRNGYYLKFQILISNQAGSAPAYRVSVDDNGISSNLRYGGNPSFSGGNIQVDEMSQTRVVFTVPQGQNLPAGQNWTLTFDAVINSPSNQAVDFLSNSGRIYYSLTQGGSADQSTPFNSGLIPLRTNAVGIPDIKEIAP